ncbi:MAG: sigma-54 dependent transcriptional regulator [Chromatiales bacterium]|jgi:two-component system response regulator FlrC
MTDPKVLIVEDDAELREALSDTLRLAGLPALTAADGPAALAALDRGESVALVVSDVQMSPMDGHDLLSEIKTRRAELPVVLMTAYGTVERAVEAMRRGAADYLVKPFDGSVLIEMVRRFMPKPDASDDELIAVDANMRELKALAGRVAGTDATVLITGESGTGKEVFARYIHDESSRRGGPFVAINCAAIPENMLEAILFGYEKGAFTGAHEARSGKFEQANGGTLLLDEVSEMALGLQAKLLRVLQEREVERLGGRRPIPLDVRVIATSNRDLERQVADGAFREDLFYRLSVFPLHLPALRERRADILPLARRLLRRHCRADVGPGFTAEAEHWLCTHEWPGNVRELDNAIQRAMILRRGDTIELIDLRFESAVATRVQNEPLEAETPERVLGSQLKHREGELIIEALRAGNGSRKEAAERLGISPRTLRYKLARLREAGVAIPG